MTLTAEQRNAVEQQGKMSFTIDGVEYVVLRSDVFQKLESALSGSLNDQDLMSLLALSADGSDWMDSSMDAYDNYDEHR